MTVAETATFYHLDDPCSCSGRRALSSRPTTSWAEPISKGRLKNRYSTVSSRILQNVWLLDMTWTDVQGREAGCSPSPSRSSWKSAVLLIRFRKRHSVMPQEGLLVPSQPADWVLLQELRTPKVHPTT